VGPGDAVVVLADPWLHGAGVIDEVLRDGRLLVLFHGEREEVFDAHELELLDVWIVGQDDAALLLSPPGS
jgi:hypothetical protein